MSIPTIVKQHLARSGGRFRVRTTDAAAATLEQAALSAQIPAAHLARPVLLASGMARLMAVLPADARLDLGRLKVLLGRPVEISLPQSMPQRPAGLEEEALPPLPGLFGVRAILDKRLEGLPEVFFPAGVSGAFIRAGRDDFLRLLGEPIRGRSLTVAPAAQADGATRVRVQSLNALPAMPGIAAEIVRLRNNPYSHANELAAVIEQDPSLTAQVLRYAASPFYGYPGRIDSVGAAIVQVLGMDFVLDLAFGLSLGKPFRNPKEGPLGLHAFWAHAVHCATLTQTLCNAITYSRRPSPGLSYLAGLLHNFGFLLLGHLFPAQFQRLNRVVAEQPQRSIAALEREAIGMSHTELGLWLMEAWDMPSEVTEAVKEHHNPDFAGEFAVYPNLIFIANTLLRRHGIGDGDVVEVPPGLLARVGLDAQEVEIALGGVLAGREQLAFMAGQLAA